MLQGLTSLCSEQLWSMLVDLVLGRHTVATCDLDM